MNLPLCVEFYGSTYEYKNELHFFKGDFPAREFEDGQQRGGHFPCASFGARAARFDDIEYAYRVPADIRNEIKQAYMATVGNREVKRGCDFRVAMIMLVDASNGKA
ncbi:Hypp8293 [Branchiostoma lanceolatum]|uniref:Hypp8293 protein n=1 Tax=Branchiostoma lanceolatum TaxID=7740 RepID=A0A8K0EHH9_BRALA|nr:Hypp8293 [Branchiostoma lanceolatum]